MSNFSYTNDSLEDLNNERELEKLRKEVKQQNQIIKDNGLVIASLREQVEEAEASNEELEKCDQLLRRDLERAKKELIEKTEELDAVSHALKEVETANDNLSRRMQARTEQLQKLVEDLAKSKAELENLRLLNQQLESGSQVLKTQLSKQESTLKRHKRDETEDLENKVSQLELKLTQQQAALAQQQATFAQQHATFTQQLEESRATILNLQKQNDELALELKSRPTTNTTIRQSSLTTSTDQTDEEMIQELYELRAKVKSLSHRQSRRSIDEEILKLREELEVTETSWRLEKQHKERYARENFILDKKLADLTKQFNALSKQHEIRCNELENRLRELTMPPPLPPKDPIKQQPLEEARINQISNITQRDFSMADEVGEFMDSSSTMMSKKSDLNTSRRLVKPQSENYCHNHRIQKSSFLLSDPIAEEKSRLDRVNELARRNKLTKPLHQTSYALELETFDDTTNEFDIKKGDIKRQALADSSNQQKPRQPVKKAEAFII